MNNNRISGHQPRDNEFQAKGLLTKIAIDHGSLRLFSGNFALPLTCNATLTTFIS
jgi:hypothetical protein